MQPYSEVRYPSKPAPASKLRFPWSEVQKELDKNGGDYSIYHYHRHDAKHLSSTITGQAERIAVRFTTPVSKEVFSFVYHVFEGQGQTKITSSRSSESEVVYWKDKDTFAIPAWCSISRTCTSTDGSAYLFAVTDRPLIEAITFTAKDSI